LPHDWAVALPFDRSADVNHGSKPIGPGFETNDIAWYRRSIELSQADDQGSMTGWYVFNAMGIFPYSPADPEYIVSVPLFDKIAITLGNGKTFTIVKKSKGTNIDKITIGGKPLEGWFVSYTDMLQGKELDIYLK
jgi:putative alpha-1,2-mannosidase